MDLAQKICNLDARWPYIALVYCIVGSCIKFPKIEEFLTETRIITMAIAASIKECSCHKMVLVRLEVCLDKTSVGPDFEWKRHT